MRLHNSVVGVALLVAVTAGMLTAAPAAHADTAACTFSAGVNLDPAIRRVPLLSGDSTYGMGGNLACEYVDTTGPGAGTEYEVFGLLSGTGVFRNDICLTGWFVSNWVNPFRPGWTTVDFLEPNATDITSLRYIARLTAGTGDLVVKDINGDPAKVGEGWMVSFPMRGSCAEPPGVSSIDIAGSLAIQL